MSPLVFALLAFISVGALGVAFVPSLLGSGRAGKRRRALQGDLTVTRAKAAVERTRDNRRQTVQDALKAQADALQQRRKKLTLKRRLQQSGLNIKSGAFIRYAVAFGVAVFVVCLLLGVMWAFAAVFGVAAGYVLPLWFVGLARKRYQQKFLDELPNAVEAIVRGVRSGMPLNDSVKIVSKEIKEPVRSEFKRVLEQQSIGKSMSEAVQILYERVPLPEVNFFVVVITVQQQAGGNLSEALSNLSRVLRNRKKMRAKVKAMSSEAKASAMIIGSMPFIVGGLITISSPNYLAPLTTTNLGHIWLGVGAVMMMLGSFVMNRMIQFDI